ncbi:hypothetical protein [Bradyrhizobium sp. JR3.5]
MKMIVDSLVSGVFPAGLRSALIRFPEYPKLKEDNILLPFADLPKLRRPE